MNGVVPSVLSANFAYLARDIRMIHEAGARSVQIDVMDGHFVPNLTVGPNVVADLRKETPVFLDVHLMIENPLKYIEAFAKAGAGLLTAHWEACQDAPAVIRAIKSLGVQAGMAIRPKTPDSVLWPLLDQLDLALVMTVEPGFGGQAFLPEMLEKVRSLRKRLDQMQKPCELQVDGGINRKTAPQAAEAGATSFVAGSAIFAQPDPRKAFQDLQQLVDLPSKRQVK
jgi:ribulose-phosphate 3-epimerase